jgi:O-antigen ligase
MNLKAHYLSKVSFAILILLTFIMPLTNKPLGILIALFSLTNIVDGILNKTFTLKKFPIFVLGISFFLIHIISVWYSLDQERAWFDIEVKLSLLIFPIVFLFKNQFISENYKYILYSFVAGSISSSFIMLIRAYLNYLDEGSIAFYYAKIALFHPSYIAMYFILSIAIIIKFMVNQKRTYTYQIFSALSVLLLLRMVFLFQSKAGVITIIAISFFLLTISIIKLRSLLLKIAITLLVVSFTLIMVQKSSRLQAMLNSVEEISKNGSSDDSTTGVRFEIWKLTLDEIKSNWFFGVGAGDIKPVLFKRYKSSNLDNALSKNLNVHNQYLETFLGQGIIGISLLLSLFVIGLKEAYLRKEWLFSVFIILSAMSFAPESMLNNQSGVIFFAFFYYSFFIFTNERSLV